MTSKHFYRQSFFPRQSWSSSFLLPLGVQVQGLADDAGLRSALGVPDPSPLSALDSLEMDSCTARKQHRKKTLVITVK